MLIMKSTPAMKEKRADETGRRALRRDDRR